MCETEKAKDGLFWNNCIRSGALKIIMKFSARSRAQYIIQEMPGEPEREQLKAVGVPKE